MKSCTPLVWWTFPLAVFAMWSGCGGSGGPPDASGTTGAPEAGADTPRPHDSSPTLDAAPTYLDVGGGFDAGESRTSAPDGSGTASLDGGGRGGANDADSASAVDLGRATPTGDASGGDGGQALADVGQLPDLSQPVQPQVSVAPGQTAQAGVAGAIVVTVPGEAIAAAGTLCVERLDFPPPLPPNVGQFVAGFAIELGGQLPARELAALATITFVVDPARLRADVPPAEAAWVVYWDGRNNRLVEEPAQVNAAVGTVTVRVGHLSSWWLYLLGPGDVHGTSPHFTYRFPAAINVSAWGTTDPFEVMAHVRSKLETFYEAYVKAGFTPPSGKVPVYLRDVLESQYDPLSGDITVSSFNYLADTSSLEHELAHELFHAFQAAQLNLFGLDARRWFVEAAADYAADALAAHSGHMGKTIDATWASSPLGLVDDKHEYATSHFLAWLAARGKGLKALQDAVFGAWLLTDHGESAFAAAAAGPGGFARTFLDYILWLETDPASPLAALPFPGFSISDRFSTALALDELASTTPKLAPYTAGWEAGKELDLLWDAPPADVTLEVRVLRGGSRAAVEQPTNRFATMKAGDAILFIAAGDAASDQPLAIFVEPIPNLAQFTTEPLAGLAPYPNAQDS